jgi:hypothetical protein
VGGQSVFQEPEQPMTPEQREARSRELLKLIELEENSIKVEILPGELRRLLDADDKPPAGCCLSLSSTSKFEQKCVNATLVAARSSSIVASRIASSISTQLSSNTSSIVCLLAIPSLPSLPPAGRFQDVYFKQYEAA